MKVFNFSQIEWKSTLQINLIRFIVAGLVWTIFVYIAGMETPPGMPGKWIYVLIWPIGYFLIFLPLGLFAGLLSRLGVSFVGFIPALMIIPADPIANFLHKFKPELIPVQDYRFIEIDLLLFGVILLPDFLLSFLLRMILKLNIILSSYLGRIMVINLYNFS